MFDAVPSAKDIGSRRVLVDRSLIRRRVRLLKRAVIAVSLAGFIALWGVVAGHIVGVTSHAQTAPKTAPAGGTSPGSGGFFDNGNGNGTGNVSPGNGSSPAIGSGGS
ncbi:MAG TPA: hypothetical protein VIP09_10105 [Dehalococcoidia bacterium]